MYLILDFPWFSSPIESSNHNKKEMLGKVLSLVLWIFDGTEREQLIFFSS